MNYYYITIDELFKGYRMRRNTPLPVAENVKSIPSLLMSYNRIPIFQHSVAVKLIYNGASIPITCNFLSRV